MSDPMPPAPFSAAMRRTAVVMVTHLWSESIAARFGRMRREVADAFDCHLLLQDDHGPVRQSWQAHLAATDSVHCLQLFDPEAARSELGLPWLATGMIPGCAHYVWTAFSRGRPHEHYWIVEGDVDYSGHWRELLEHIEPERAALVAPHVRTPEQDPRWMWWPSVRGPAPEIDAAQLRRIALKAFLPVCRVSAKALELVHAAQLRGWRGHAEALLPTLLNHFGERVVDLRAVADCHEGDLQDPYPQDLARQSTIRYRPEVTLSEFMRRGGKPRLFHPVKQDWHFDGRRVVVQMPWREAG